MRESKIRKLEVGAARNKIKTGGDGETGWSPWGGKGRSLDSQVLGPYPTARTADYGTGPPSHSQITKILLSREGP